MAKMIKCPTCQTQIEVPATLTGQVVKCPGCGKGLKLVAKKKDPATNPNSSVSGGSMAGTMAGGSISAMSFHDQPPPQDDLPNLDTNCQVCGRPTPFDELSEDNGKMVCRDCIKGARSSIARAAGGAETIGFKAPEYRPTRRAKMINVTPGFLAAVFLALVWIGCQMYLSFNPKPVGKGTAQAHAVKGKPGTPGDLSKPPTTMASATTAPMTSAEAHTGATQPAPGESPSPGTAVAGTQPSESEAATTQGTGVALVPPKPDGGTIFTDDGKTAVPAVPVPGVPAVPAVPIPATEVAVDPLDRGLELFQEKKYREAVPAFNAAREKYVVGKLNAQLTPQQSVIINGLAAAYLGSGQADEVRKWFKVASDHGDRSRALALNRAVAVLQQQAPTFDALGKAAADVKIYLNANAGDEYAADIFGTLLGRAEATPRAPKDKVQPFWDYLDQYNDAIAQKQQMTDKLKWGTKWLPADDVKRYRDVRKTGGGINVTQAAQQLEAARATLRKAEIALSNARRAQQSGQAGVDVAGAERSVEAAKLSVSDLEKKVQAAAATLEPPVWLEKVEPALPQ